MNSAVARCDFIRSVSTVSVPRRQARRLDSGSGRASDRVEAPQPFADLVPIDER